MCYKKGLLSEAGKALKLAELSLSILILVCNLKGDFYSFNQINHLHTPVTHLQYTDLKEDTKQQQAFHMLLFNYFLLNKLICYV